jgi:transcription-repair coupling factor (superfamily II helicase)
MERFLAELVPSVRVGIAHGQMAEGKLEQVMARFVNRDLDLLLATAIIESGLDIPSANTIIVNRADHFGLSQLYQIRGRVGRSRERAYAYLLVPARRPVTKDAQKRLEVLQRFSELGAGFRIASHDLDIRGAGNLLGKDQSGQIEAIGFELYSELLDEAVRELRGEAPREDIDPDVQLPVPAIIPDGYMPDVHQRLFFYKRFAQATTDEELDEVRAEIVDRCGEPPEELDALCEVMALKVRLRALAIRALEAGPGRLVFTLGETAALDPFLLAKHVQGSGGALRLTPDMKLVAAVGRPPAAPPGPSKAGRGKARPAAKVPARPAPPVASPAMAAASGRELLAAAREVLAGLSRCARAG